ncbi:MAG: hypothetical protein M3146_04420, partial [Thermoproteota archaeon]|nr:hypothetical protein [Thermoproteota archaeon]
LSNSDEILEMNGRFDLLLKLRAINLEQRRDILVNSVRKCSSVVELKFMSMLKTTKENKPYIPLFWRKTLVLASLLVRRLPYGLPILFFFL